MGNTWIRRRSTFQRNAMAVPFVLSLPTAIAGVEANAPANISRAGRVHGVNTLTMKIQMQLNDGSWSGVRVRKLPPGRSTTPRG